MRKNKLEDGFKKGKVKNQTVVGNETYLNTATGTMEDFTVINKHISKDINFHKIWLQDVLNVLDSFGNKKILVITYLLKSMRNEDNTFNGTYREIAESCEVSLPTVSLVMNELIDSDVIRKLSSATYRFNPSLIVKGSSDKRKNLLIKYSYQEDDKKQTENAKQIKEFVDPKEAFEIVDPAQTTIFGQIQDISNNEG